MITGNVLGVVIYVNKHDSNLEYILYQYSRAYRLVFVSDILKNADVILRDLELLNDRLTVYNYVSGVRSRYMDKVSLLSEINPVASLEVPKYRKEQIYDMAKQFGNFVRSGIYLQAVGRMASLGDEIEAVMMGYEMGKNIIHYGFPEVKLHTLDEMLTYRTNIDESTIPKNNDEKEERGQRKLETITVPFLILWQPTVVIYIGAAPGNNLSKIVKILSDTKFILVDPRRIRVTGTNVEHVNKKVDKDWILRECYMWEGAKVCLIYDVRVDYVDELQWEEHLMAEQMIIEDMIPKLDSMRIKYIIKFHPVEDINIKGKCKLWLQPCARARTRETRIVSSDKINNIIVSSKDYNLALKNWNVMRFRFPRVEKEQDIAIWCESIIRDDIRKHINEGVALFSISNQLNFKDARIEDTFIRVGTCLLMYPNLHVARRWIPGLYDIWFYLDWYIFKVEIDSNIIKYVARIGARDWVVSKNIGKVKSKVDFEREIVEIKAKRSVIIGGIDVDNKKRAVVSGSEYTILVDGKILRIDWMDTIIQRRPNGRIFKDKCVDVNILDRYRCTWFNVGTFIINSLYGFDRSHPLCMLWIMILKKEGSVPQTVVISQTYHAKLVTSYIRDFCGLDEDSLHIFRRASLIYLRNDRIAHKLFRKIRVRIIKHIRVNGEIIYSNGRMYVAVSGHMINLLLSSNLGLVSLKRFVDTIDMNIDSRRNNAAIAAELKDHNLAEDNEIRAYDRWHSWIEYYCAVISYLIICKYYMIRVNVRSVKYILNWLKDRTSDNFLYTPGWQAKTFTE